jgi:2-haloacid dehalogenase
MDLTDTSEPRCVVLDIGNVLYKWEPHRVLAEQIPDEFERRRFIEEADLFTWHGTLDRGRALADAVDELSESMPAYAWLIDQWGELYQEMVREPIAGSIEIVAELHARRVPLFIISNFPADFWPSFRHQRRDLFDRFSDIIVSGEVGIVKPDAAIFNLALHRFGIAPSSAIFIDDVRDNVDAAASVGFHTHRFITPDRMRTALEQSGLI